MAYTTPKTWSNEPLVASDLNTHLRDNLEEIKDPPSANYELNESADYTTTSTSFVDIDATEGKLQLTINTNGGDVLVHFHGTLTANGALSAYFDIDVDAARNGGDDGIEGVSISTNTPVTVSFTRLITGLAAGSHTFKLQWKRRTANTLTMFAGSGNSNWDLHPQFWAREVS
jgi:hypothetical protein